MKEKKHLTLRERNIIQGGLANNKTFKQIGLELEKAPFVCNECEDKAHCQLEKR